MNEEIEKLIEITLADGQLTDKERTVLYRKATEFGIDQDELEIVIDSKLFLIQKNSQNNSVKFGEIKKCPSCNAQINSFSTFCVDCGYEFRNIDANNSVKTLSEKLEKVVAECELKSYSHMVGRGYGNQETARLDDIASKQKFVIKNFPVPNSRDDILELLYFIQPKIKIGFRADKNVFDWRNKYREVTNRAISSFRTDKKMLDEINNLKMDLNKIKPVGYIFCLYSTSSAGFKWVLSMFGFMALCGFIYFILKYII
jgi:hypothetical protein